MTVPLIDHICSALMVHGGGNIMLSRSAIRSAQTLHLLQLGFLPVSVDYRLCPEINVIDGAMTDVRDSLNWVRRHLPSIAQDRGITVDSNKVMAVGWSTGGHLAMTLSWTAPAAGMVPPNAILAFYPPTDFASEG